MAHNDENSPAERRAKLGKPPQPGRCCGVRDADGPQSGPQPDAGPNRTAAWRPPAQYGLNNITSRTSDLTESMPQHPGLNVRAAYGLRPQNWPRAGRGQSL